MTNEELQAQLKEMQARLDREFQREVPWFKARFAAIAADPLTAGFVAVLSAAATYAATYFKLI